MFIIMMMNWISSKSKSWSVKDTVKHMKRKYTGWGKLISNHISDNELLCKTHKSLEHIKIS